MQNATISSSIPHILDRHIEDAAFLWLQRDAAVAEPHYDLKDLAELDERLAAHLDGIKVAGESAWQAVEQGLQFEEPGEYFVAAWLAIAELDGAKFEWLLNRAQSEAGNYRALLAAFAWHDISQTQEWLSRFLAANNRQYLSLGVRLATLKRVGLADELLTILAKSSVENDRPLVINCLRAIGELQRKDLLAHLTPFIDHDDSHFSYWALRSATLLGDFKDIDKLKQHVINDSGFALDALQIVARVLKADQLRSLLQLLMQQPHTQRLALQGAGFSGDPYWIAGLLKYMQQPELARVCGEAFSLITGVDLSYQDLDTDQPDNFETGPSEDPDDENLGLDVDSDLAWPNVELVTQWWRHNEHQYVIGLRYLCAAQITPHSCHNLLIKGYQRQRIAASYELALMGQAFFETRALAKSQQKLLAQYQ